MEIDFEEDVPEDFFENLDLPPGPLSFLSADSDNSTFQDILDLNDDDFLMSDPPSPSFDEINLSKEEGSDIEQPRISPDKPRDVPYRYNAYGFPRPDLLVNLILYMAPEQDPNTTIFTEDLDEMFHFLGIYVLLNKEDTSMTPVITSNIDVINAKKERSEHPRFNELYTIMMDNNLLKLIPLWKKYLLTLIKIYDKLPSIDVTNAYNDDVKKRKEKIFEKVILNEKESEFEIQDKAALASKLKAAPKSDRANGGSVYYFERNPFGVIRSKEIKEVLVKNNDLHWLKFYIEDYMDMSRVLKTYDSGRVSMNTFFFVF